MPRLPIDYSNSIIYKLCCKDIQVKEIYVGSTTDFRARKFGHKSICANQNSKKYHLNVYKFIREHGNWENWDMVMIEQFECSNKLQLHKRERYWIEVLDAKLNGYIPSRTSQEYYQTHKERLLRYQEENKEQRSIYRKQNYICECGIIYTHSNKSRHVKTKKHIDLLNNPFLNTAV